MRRVIYPSYLVQATFSRGLTECRIECLNKGRKRMQLARTFSSLSVALVLFLLSALPGLVGSAAAQQQEKRIAFVVGNAAYAKVPLATTANDAGLVAQQLQAAGFDVIGARDL